LSSKKYDFDTSPETEEDCPIADEPLPRIEPGEYTAICEGTEIKKTPGWPRKIYIHFFICKGKYVGVNLFMACNYPKGTISPRRKYYKQWMLVNGGPPKKGNKLNRKIFKGTICRIRVRYTKPEHPDDNEILQYSVVDSIIEIITDEYHK